MKKTSKLVKIQLNSTILYFSYFSRFQRFISNSIKKISVKKYLKNVLIEDDDIISISRFYIFVTFNSEHYTVTLDRFNYDNNLCIISLSC